MPGAGSRPGDQPIWHGNVFLALQTIDYVQLDADNEDANPEQRKLSKAVSEFGGDIRADGALGRRRVRWPGPR